MKIKLEKCLDGWYADCEDCPGTPPNGTGKTEVEAVLCLMYRLMFSHPGPSPGLFPYSSFDDSWLKYIKFGEPILVNGKLWQDVAWKNIAC